MPADTINPDYKVFEEQLKKHPLVKDKVEKLLQKRKFSTPIAISKEKHNVEEIRKLLEYDAIATYFGGKIPADLKEQWEHLSKRPNITEEEYNSLKNNQKPTDYEETKKKLGEWQTTFPDLEPSVVKNAYDTIKNDLSKWTTIFPSQTPQQAKDSQGSNIEGLPTDWKDRLSKLKDLEEKLEKEPKEPNIIALKNSLLGEENKNLWELVNNRLIKIIQEVVPKAEKISK